MKAIKTKRKKGFSIPAGTWHIERKRDMPNRICNFGKAFARSLLRKPGALQGTRPAKPCFVWGLRKNASRAEGFSTPAREVLLLETIKYLFVLSILG